MAKTNQATVANVETTTEDKSVMTETQEKVLKDATEMPDATTSNVVEDMRKLYLDGDIEEATVTQALERGEITVDQCAAILATEEKGNYHRIKDDLEARVAAGPLNNAGALVAVEGHLKAGDISEADASKLRQLFATDSGSNTAMYSEADKVKEDILEYFKAPYETVEDAEAVSTDIAERLMKQSREFEQSYAATLTVAFASLAFHYMKRGELPVSITKDKTTGAKRATVHLGLWNKIKSTKALGETEELITKIGSYEQNNGKVRDPYTDKAIQPYIKPTTMKACLLAYGHVSGVCFGYITKKGNSGKRFSPLMVFDREDELPENANKDDYFRCVCVPANLLKPFDILLATRSKIVEGKERTSVEGRHSEANTDRSLRYLFDPQVEPLYQHFFANHVLEYDTESRGDKKAPLGIVNGSHDPSVTPKARQRDTNERTEAATPANGKSVAELEQQLAIMRTERDKAQQTIETDNIIGCLQAFTGLANNEKMTFTESSIQHALEFATVVASKRLLSASGNNAASVYKDRLRSIIRLQKAIDRIVAYDEGKAGYVMQDRTGVTLAFLEG